ncbi:Puromycin-sensitive aminopeptidase-like protein [Trichinella spiralis]|uniref:Puromycin-sensitive aminopeptidase-like protein n=1 Tax=Trichinella spiralis TaxID=6334 RepID=A0ABR3KJN7_TRISP
MIKISANGSIWQASLIAEMESVDAEQVALKNAVPVNLSITDVLLSSFKQLQREYMHTSGFDDQNEHHISLRSSSMLRKGERKSKRKLLDRWQMYF